MVAELLLDRNLIWSLDGVGLEPCCQKKKKSLKLHMQAVLLVSSSWI